MSALDFPYNCCTQNKLPDMSDCDELVIYAVLPNTDEDGNTNTELLMRDADELTAEQRASMFYTLHAHTEGGDLEPLHDETSLLTLMQIAQALSDETDLPVFFCLPDNEINDVLSTVSFNGGAEGAQPELSAFESLEVNAVIDNDDECEALFGVASGKAPAPSNVFYTVYGRLSDGRAKALHDECSLDAIKYIASALAVKASIPLVIK